MKAATVKNLKDELRSRSNSDIVELCLRLSKFKKENKELLTYLLYESSNEASYINNIKEEIKEEFLCINRSSNYFIKKSVRKILRTTNKYIRYSGKPETKVELMMFFCSQLKTTIENADYSIVLVNLLNRQINTVQKALLSLHEDLQYDYQVELDMLT
jgi:hypothetical protein